LGLLGAAFMWPLATGAQDRAIPVVGFLSAGSPRTFARFLEAFQQGLREQGFVEGRNVAIDYRWAEGRIDELDALATELVADRVALIAATGGMRSAQAAKKATASIPIVFVLGADPVQVGLVASFNKPNGNATGTMIVATELASKRLSLLYDLDPHILIFGILVNPASLGADIEIQQVTEATKHTGRSLLVLRASSGSEIDAAFASAVKQQVGAVVIGADALYMTHRAQLVGLAATYKLPVIYPFREYVDDGGLISYGPNLASAYRVAGIYAGRILKGTQPKDLPVESPKVFELVINLKTAKALGIEVPPALLALADQLIE